jgi:DNA repair exonuclease SbcCD ATPase subunit
LADLSATLSDNPDEIRREYARFSAENKSLMEQLQATRQEERAAQGEVDGWAEKIAQIREAIADRHGKLQTEDARRKLCEQAIAAARKALPADWQSRADGVALAEMNRLRGERDELERRGVENRANELKQARIDAESLNQALAELERELEQIPADARRDPGELAELLKKARGSFSTKADALNSARNERANLEARIKQRSELRKQLHAADLELNRYKLLSELLGRDRLQRHLVRQAERQIVDCANGVLDRLSGGQLMMRLVGNEDGAAADHALELECWNRTTGQSPINVAFLSGSQRFRVAVSLALGIGQYASRQHRPIESVIIDEGFGCLDRNGLQVMIQELQNLRGHLQCILLVSHQEEFADSFADGYRFELADGATRVSRLQR